MESLTVLPTATLLQEKCTYFFVVFIKFPFTIYITRTILRLLTFDANNRVSALFMIPFTLMGIDSSR